MTGAMAPMASLLPLRLIDVSFEADGKSLLMRLCHGLLQPTTGQVRFNGPETINRRRRHATVFQRPVMLRRLALDNVAYGLALVGVPRAERPRTAEEALDKSAEEAFVAEGAGVHRREVMYNDFVLIGPKADPAHVAGGKDITFALKAIMVAQAPFVSRGDRSGTHAAELKLWADAGIDIATSKGAWYRETGSGMGASLNTASAMDAYLLSDRGTWLAFKNRGDLVISVEGDKRLFNQYGVIMVNPARFPQVKRADARAFIDWLVSPDGQAAIASYQIDGQQLFFPNASP